MLETALLVSLLLVTRFLPPFGLGLCVLDQKPSCQFTYHLSK